MLPFLKTVCVPRVGVGIAIGRKELVGALARRGERKRWVVDCVCKEGVEGELFVGTPEDTHLSSLVEGFAKVTKALGPNVSEIQLALPDAAMYFSILRIKKSGLTRRMRRELVNWRLAEEIRREPAEIVTTFQTVGQSEDGVRILGLAADKSWVRMVETAARLAGFIPVIVDASLCYRVNQLHTDGIECYALLTITDESWNLAIVHQGILQFSRSDWIEKKEGISGYHDIVSEAARSLFLHDNRCVGPEVIFVSANGCESLSGLLKETTGLDTRDAVYAIDLPKHPWASGEGNAAAAAVLR